MPLKVLVKLWSMLSNTQTLIDIGDGKNIALAQYLNRLSGQITWCNHVLVDLAAVRVADQCALVADHRIVNIELPRIRHSRAEHPASGDRHMHALRLGSCNRLRDRRMDIQP